MKSNIGTHVDDLVLLRIKTLRIKDRKIAKQNLAYVNYIQTKQRRIKYTNRMLFMKEQNMFGDDSYIATILGQKIY